MSDQYPPIKQRASAPKQFVSTGYDVDLDDEKLYTTRPGYHNTTY